MATILRPPLIFNAPPKKPPPRVDSYPNLSVTTLAPGTPLALPLSAVRMDWSAPRRKSWLTVDEYIAPLTLGINPNAGVLNWSNSAPQRVRQNGVDSYPNLLTTTLAVQNPYALPLSADRIEWTAPPRKKQVQADQYVNPVVLQPVPLVMRWDFSAPQPKRPVTIDVYPNLSGTTLAPIIAFPLPLSALRSDWRAPPNKTPVYVDITPNPVVLQAVPGIQRLDQSAPPRKRPVVVDAYPNLSITTLAPIVTIPLPLSAQRIDWSAPQVKYRPQVDQPMQRPITLNPVPKVMQLNDSAPRVKYQAKLDYFPTDVLRGYPVTIVVTPETPNARQILIGKERREIVQKANKPVIITRKPRSIH